MLIKTKKKKKKKTIKCRDSSLHLYPTTNGYLAGRRELYKTVWASSSSARILRGIFLLLKELKRNEKRKSQKTHQQKHEVHTIAQSKAPFFLLHHRQMIVISVERVALLLPFSCCVIALSVPLVFLSSFSTGAGKTRNRSQSCFFFLSPLSYSTSQVSPHMNLDGASSLFYNLFASSSSSMNMLCSVRAPREYNL